MVERDSNKNLPILKLAFCFPPRDFIIWKLSWGKRRKGFWEWVEQYLSCCCCEWESTSPTAVWTGKHLPYSCVSGAESLLQLWGRTSPPAVVSGKVPLLQLLWVEQNLSPSCCNSGLQLYFWLVARCQGMTVMKLFLVRVWMKVICQVCFWIR